MSQYTYCKNPECNAIIQSKCLACGQNHLVSIDEPFGHFIIGVLLGGAIGFAIPVIWLTIF